VIHTLLAGKHCFFLFLPGVASAKKIYIYIPGLCVLKKNIKKCLSNVEYNFTAATYKGMSSIETL
jgi:hypothetical protein